MKRAVRAGALACVTLVALAFAGSALAAYQPRLGVLHASPRLNAGGQTFLQFQTGRTDEATAKLTIYAPAGYRANLAQAPGTRLGTAQATIQARRVSPDVFLPVEGVIQADSPANWTPQAIQCTQSATHQNVWVLALTASGRQLRVPIFVDATAGPEAAFSSVKLQVCLSPPDVPEEQGGAPFGAKVVDALLAFNAGVFTTPGSAGPRIWLAYVTPYTNFRPPVNAAGTVQARAIVPLPQTVTLTARFNRRTKRVTLSGTVRAAGIPMQGARLSVRSGTRANRLRAAGATRAVNARGRFSATRRMTRTTFFQVLIVGAFIADQPGCALPHPAPAAPRCTATIGISAVSRILRVRYRR